MALVTDGVDSAFEHMILQAQQGTATIDVKVGSLSVVNLKQR